MSRLLLLLLTLVAAPVLADESVSRDAADLARAKALRDQASEAYVGIDRERKEGEARCARKFLVNRCLDQLREDLNKREQEAKALQVEAGKLERGVKAREVAAREATREIDHPTRVRQQEQQGVQYKAQQAGKQDDQTKRRAEHDKAITEGPARAKQLKADRAARDAALAKKRDTDAKAATQRATQAKEDYERYEERRKEFEQRRAAKAAKAGASVPAAPASAPVAPASATR